MSFDGAWVMSARKIGVMACVAAGFAAGQANASVGPAPPVPATSTVPAPASSSAATGASSAPAPAAPASASPSVEQTSCWAVLVQTGPLALFTTSELLPMFTASFGVRYGMVQAELGVHLHLLQYWELGLRVTPLTAGRTSLYLAGRFSRQFPVEDTYGRFTSDILYLTGGVEVALGPTYFTAFELGAGRVVDDGDMAVATTAQVGALLDW